MSEDTKSDKWVYERLAYLHIMPSREDADTALARYRDYECRARHQRRVRQAAILSLVIAVLVVAIVPASRAVARQLLDRFYMRRPEAVRVNDTAIGTAGFFHLEYAAPGPSRFVFNMAKAREQAGFEPRLPALLTEQLASGLAVLKLSDPRDAKMEIEVNGVSAALQRRGITDVRVPRAWDGVQIGYHLGASVVVVFLSGMLAQSLPPSIVTPGDFPILDFTEVALRAAGLSHGEAHNARRLFIDTGGAFAIVPVDAKSTFREIALKSGPGLLFENDSDQDERRTCSLCAGPHERVLTWSTSDRVFQLRSQTMSFAQVIALANAIN